MYCQNCGAPVDDVHSACSQCGKPPMRTQRFSVDDDAAVRMMLPVGRSLWAIVAGYAGLFAFLIIPAPLALGTGILALRDLKRHPDKHGYGRALFGTIVGGLGTTVLIAFLAAATFAETNR